MSVVRHPARRKRYRSELLERQCGTCWYCGLSLGSDVTFEHLIPKTHGGPDNLHNLVLAHEWCNQYAGERSLEEKFEIRARFHARLPELVSA